MVHWNRTARQTGITFLRIIVERWNGLLYHVVRDQQGGPFFRNVTSILQREQIAFGLNQYPWQCTVLLVLLSSHNNIPSLGMKNAFQDYAFVCENIYWLYLFLAVEWGWEQVSLWRHAIRPDYQPSTLPPCSRLERHVCTGSPGTGGLRSDAPHCGIGAPGNSSHSTPAGHMGSFYTCKGS